MAVTYDKALQNKLDHLWFTLPSDTPQESLAERQAMLVREFQIGARCKFGAQVDAEGGQIAANSLQQVELSKLGLNTTLPDGFPHGVADEATITAIDAWREARLRCPIIFQARMPEPNQPPWNNVVQQGFQFHDELQKTKPRVFACDFTGRYPMVDGKATPVVVGSAVARAISHKTTARGSVASSSHTLNADFKPDTLLGKAWGTLNPAEKSTFRLLAALCSVEAGGVFDGINAWDTSVLSAGPYHYTAFPAGDLGASELGAFIAYFAFRSPSVYARLINNYGIGATEAWRKSMFDKDDRVYRARLGFVDQSGHLVAPIGREQCNWLRTWPAFYRLQWALRTSSELQTAFWPFARQRIHDLLATEWGATTPPYAKTIGDVFKSERSIALLLRWHVFKPHHVVNGGSAGVVPKQIVTIAELNEKSVKLWDDQDEQKLATAFAKAHVSTLKGKSALALQTSLAAVAGWSRPQWTEGDKQEPSLSVARGFQLFEGDLPLL